MWTRIGAPVALILTLGSSASADSPRYRPAAGATVTYRLMLTVNSGGHEQTVGQIYRIKVTSDNGTISEGTLTPLALAWLCPDSDTSSPCKQAKSLPNARREGDLVIAPLPEDVSEQLGKIGKVSIRDLLHVTQVYPIPGLQDMSETANPRIGGTPLSVQTTALDCDEAALKPFLPLGATAQATVPCKMTVEMAQSRVPGAKDGKYAHDMTYDLSFAGHEHVAAPAGAFEVGRIKFKGTGGPADGVVTEGEWEFVESLGVSAKYSAVTHFPNSNNSSRIMRDLLKYEP